MKPSTFLFIACTLFIQQAKAEQKITKGHYEMYFNTFPSTFLDKKTATTHQIKRSKSRGILSITLMDTSQEPPQAIEAKVTMKGQNLLGQNKSIELKVIKENDGGIYYLGLFRMNNEENINFTISAKANISKQVLSHKFTREFFTD